MWLIAFALISTAHADDSAQCAEDLKSNMELVLKRLQEVQAQQEVFAASELPTTNSTTTATEDESSSSSPISAPVPLPSTESDTSDDYTTVDAVAESPV